MLLGKNTFLASPSVARQCFTFLCSVRSWPSLYLPGYCRWSHSNKVFVSNPAMVSSLSLISGQSSSNGSCRVRQSLSAFFWLGSSFDRIYLRAVFSLIPAFATAIDNVFFCLLQLHQTPHLGVSDHPVSSSLCEFSGE